MVVARDVPCMFAIVRLFGWPWRSFLDMRVLGRHYYECSRDAALHVETRYTAIRQGSQDCVNDLYSRRRNAVLLDSCTDLEVDL